ncbi:COR domain-containing protein [Nodosilinea sp. FACHB-141]|uniref:leucine-rich repeat domain-containing protein n=1 Tax=Cyanophyceae TaxID=3028117 RepID=UPI0037CA7BB8
MEVDAIGLCEEPPNLTDEAESRIQKALRTGETTLTLPSLNLTTIPVSITKLIHLTVLNLSFNKIRQVPKELCCLSNLKILNLAGNKISELPRELAQLKSLETLNIYSNELTSLPDELNWLINLKKLNVSRNKLLSIPKTGYPSNLDTLIASENQLSYLPKSLEKCKKILYIDLSQNQLTSLPKEIGELGNLVQLDLSQNQLTSLPKEIGELGNLVQLDLSQNQLTSLPKEIGELGNLVQLDLSQNQLTSLPKEIGELGNLVQLDLSQNQLTSLPKEVLHELVKLGGLDLSKNRLSSLPKEIDRLKSLNRFNLFQNRLSFLPQEIGNLKKLEHLNLAENQLSSLPGKIGDLKNLVYLDASNNKLNYLPREVSGLEQLIHLNISQNNINSLTQNLGCLKNLRQLDIADNNLSEIPEKIGKIKTLFKLDLSRNQLKALPNELAEIRALSELYLHGNEKLNLPVEILGSAEGEEGPLYEERNSTPQSILDYYFRALANSQPLNEAKLILVGFGAAGKTSLVNRLIYESFDPKSAKTEGIQITPWEMCLNDSEDIKLHVWDFGGQEIMHSTHQFFLTERSLYVLVLNGRQGHEDADAEYWLELIQSFGGDSPVLVVLNKIKEHPFDVNRGALQQKFPNIREFIATDCETGQGIDLLRAAIERETDALEHLRDPFPASWVAIKNRLSEMADNYISFEQYRAICQTDGEADYGAQDSLAVHLHSLGIALNYKDDPRLRDTHVLNPHWVTNGIYTLLNAYELADTKGELEAACLARNLDVHNYPAERHGFLLELMRKFELCFRFQDDEHRYLIPDLLDKQQPPAAAEFDPADCLNFRYEYPILPEGLLPRFIVRTHVLIEHQLRWRTGVILTFEGNRALVKADPQDRCVSISVDGLGASRRRLLAVIRSDFERIHRSFKFTPKELVPVPGHPSVTVDYKELLVREEHRQTSFDVFTGEGLISLNVRDLLNGVDLEGTRHPTVAMDRHSQALRLFYSYSHKDETLRDELETHLKLLQRQGLIQPWHDRRILPGDDWANDIDDNLNRADIILLLVSSDFIASDYCYDLEMTRAMERHAAGEARVIPIILRPTDWKNTPFSKLQSLPKNAEAVTQWSDRDAAWLNVETGIKRVAELLKGDKRL